MTQHLVAEILSHYLTLAERMNDVCSRLLIPGEDLFGRIARGKAHFTSSDLFSYLLTLPVMFTCQDSENIFTALLLDKTQTKISLDDFRRVVVGLPWA